MKWKGYPKYKDSGAEWLGKVPIDWQVMPLKWRIRTQSGDGIASTDVFPEMNKESPVPVIGGNGIMGYCSTANTLSPAIVVGRVGALCGNVHEVLYSAWITDNALVLSIQKNAFNLKYLAAALRSRNLNEIADKTAQPLITGTRVRAEFCPMPLLSEQTAIANFLDHETGRLDTLIAKKQALIGLLKEKRTALISQTVTRGLPPDAAREFGLAPHTRFKDSRIEWLGEIPELWKVSSVKYESVLVSKGTTPSTIGKEMTDEGIRFLKAENLKDSMVTIEPEFYIDAETDRILSRSRLKAKDVLIVIAGATTGKTAVVENLFLPANTNQAVCFIRLKNKKFAAYLSAWISTKFIQDIVWNSAVQSAQPNLAMEDIKSFPCLVPPENELVALSAYLDRETNKIDTLITKIETAVTRLQEYRTALITAAVTGKIDVRDHAAKKESA